MSEDDMLLREETKNYHYKLLAKEEGESRLINRFSRFRR